MREEVTSLIRRACYIGTGATLFIVVSLLGVCCRLPYIMNVDSFAIMAAICFLFPPFIWPVLHRLCYIAFTDIDKGNISSEECGKYLDGYSTFRSKELDELKKKYDSKESRKKKEDSFYNMTI